MSVGFWKRLWCALRDHPYPKEYVDGEDAYTEWLKGNEPFPPNLCCSNCGKELKYRRRGMRS